MQFNLSRWALENRSLVVYIMIAATIAGLAAFFRLGRDEEPGNSVRCNPQHLGGLLGTADDAGGTIEGFTYIVEHLKAKGLVEQQGYPGPNGTTGYRLTVAGWARFEELHHTSHGSLAQPKPAPDPTPTLSPRVAVVLTAIQAETEAVLRHLVDPNRQCVANTWFHTGRFDRWTVAIAEVGPGNARAATVAVRAFTYFKPEIAAFVGIAAGLKDVGLGDVVVATKVYNYESGKEIARGFQVRPDLQTSHHELEQRARVLRTSTSWHNKLDFALWSDRKPSVHVGPIAAGEAVVASTKGQIARHLKQHYSDALAVEMEGRGFLEAAHIDSGCRAVVVRAISDRLTSKAQADKLGWQRRAADAAATFFFEMLALESPPQPDHTHTTNVYPPAIQPDEDAKQHLILGRVRQFHNERVEKIAGPTPQVPVLVGAILVMHLAPLHTFDTPQPSSFAEISRNPNNFPPFDTRPRDWKLNFDGLLTGSNNDGLGKPQRAYVYVFRSGTTEAVVSNLARGESRDALQLPNIQSVIIHYARVYATSLEKFGIHPPLAIFVSLARIKNMRLLQDFIGTSIMEDLPYGLLTADILHFGEAIFETIPQDDNISARMLDPILAHLANAAGLATSPYFDSAGNYTLKVACPVG